jgi:hypothetical protein
MSATLVGLNKLRTEVSLSADGGTQTFGASISTLQVAASGNITFSSNWTQPKVHAVSPASIQFEEFERVKLKQDLCETIDSRGKLVNLPKGTTGTIVMVYDQQVGVPNDQLGYEVEFCDGLKTLALLDLKAADLELAE